MDDGDTLKDEERLIALMKRRTNLVAKFDGRHCREGRIAIINGKCDKCHKADRNVLVMDASDGEYAPGAICRPCADAAFRRKGAK